MGTVRLGKRTEKRTLLIKDFVSLASLEDLVFGGWDIHGESCYETALRSSVLNSKHLEVLRPQLETVRPWKGGFQSSIRKAFNRSARQEVSKQAPACFRAHEGYRGVQEDAATESPRDDLVW